MKEDDGWTIYSNEKPGNNQDIRGLSRNPKDSGTYWTTGTYKNGNYYVDGKVIPNLLLWQEIPE